MVLVCGTTVAHVNGMTPNPAVHRRCAIKPRSAGDLHVSPQKGRQ